MNREHFSALAAFYRELEEELAGLRPVCRGCGACCRFDLADHVLYASDLEREYLVAADPRPPLAASGAELVAAGLRCPYQSGDDCLARTGRVLGCRLHFCRWPDPDAAADLAERWHIRLKNLHDALAVDWRYSPLLPLERR